MIVRIGRAANRLGIWCMFSLWFLHDHTRIRIFEKMGDWLEDTLMLELRDDGSSC